MLNLFFDNGGKSMDNILLMLPGPTTVDPRVLAAMSKAVVNHRGAKYGEPQLQTPLHQVKKC